MGFLCFALYKLGYADSVKDLTMSLFALTAILVGLMLYFVPAIVAGHRRHHNRVPILLTNLFLGWTFIGWVAALIWSTTAVVAQPVIK
jgi:hypothetical protein